MKIVIEGQDYSATLDATVPMKIARKLNEPSVCQFALNLQAGGPLVAPTRFESLAVTGDDGTVYFTGYVVGTPMPEFAGLALDGPCYRFAIEAASDEVLLDQVLMAPSKGLSGLNAGPLFSVLVAHAGSNGLTTGALGLSTPGEIGRASCRV